MSKIGLVIEGGGFRGIFTAGILDYMLDQEWHLPYVIGVSMGACNGANYISKQKGRSMDIPFDYMSDHRYLSYRNMITKGSLFGMDFIFDEIPKKHNLFDFDTFYKSEQVFKVVAMDCQFGGSQYFDKDELNGDEFLSALKASCSLPFISKMVMVKGRNYLDGGVSDSIPIMKAFEDGVDKVIVLLTRPRGYRKEPSRGSRLSKIIYKGYPEVTKAIDTRYQSYNQALDQIDRLEKEGKVLPIYPKSDIDLGRAEKNREKLKNVYLDGYTLAKEIHQSMENFINSD